MRPKKRILLVNANETGRRTQAFVLRTRGFRVEEVPSVQAVGKLDSVEFDLVVLVLATARERELAVGAWGAPVLALLPAKVEARGLHAERVLSAKCSMAELVDSAKVLALHKRGPKKATPERPCWRDEERTRVSECASA